MAGPRPALTPPRTSASSSAGLAAAALAVAGWLLLMVSVPVAIFLTWWGGCPQETCPAASGLDRAAYLFDFASWLVLPALAFGALRGWRPAAFGLLAIGLVVAGQVVAAILGARGFQAFAIVVPAAALIAASGVVGIRPALGRGDNDRSTSRTGLIGLVVVSIVVVVIALQGVLVGGIGMGQGLLVLVAVSLAVITVLAFINRSRRPRPPGPRPRD